jgi:beta-phosphoglucomutase-like phosphatase (HAD superfamily)
MGLREGAPPPSLGACSAGPAGTDPHRGHRVVEPRLCWALEDSHNGVRSAVSAGMMTIMVPDLLGPTDEIRGLCTIVACDLHDAARQTDEHTYFQAGLPRDTMRCGG